MSGNHAPNRGETKAPPTVQQGLSPLFRKATLGESTRPEPFTWTHSGFSLDAGEKPVASQDVEGRKRLAEYVLRPPFSLEKITWNESTGKVIYRSKRSWHTKRNFQIFGALDFLAATVEHIPPKNQQTVRYYGLYSNKSRGMAAKNGRKRPEMAESKRPERQETPLSGTPSLPPEAAKLGARIRDHWGVENRCHYGLDLTFNEDHCQTRDRPAAQNLSILREMSGARLKSHPHEGSLKSKRQRAALSEVFRSEVVAARLDNFFA